MLFEKISSKNKSQLAAEMLLEVIQSEQILPGEKLPAERIMAKEMGLSRNTLREAIAALQIVGILDIRHGQGSYVVSLDNLSNVNKTLNNIFASSDDPFMIIDARIAFEPGTVALACHVANNRDILELETILTSIIESIENNKIIEYTVADYDFHLKIANCIQNPIISKTMEYLVAGIKQPLWQSMKKNIFTSIQIQNRRIEEHKNILLSIKNRNPRLAQANLFEHLVNSKNRLLVEIEK